MHPEHVNIPSLTFREPGGFRCQLSPVCDVLFQQMCLSREPKQSCSQKFHKFSLWHTGKKKGVDALGISIYGCMFTSDLHGCRCIEKCDKSGMSFWPSAFSRYFLGWVQGEWLGKLLQLHQKFSTRVQLVVSKKITEYHTQTQQHCKVRDNTQDSST